MSTRMRTPMLMPPHLAVKAYLEASVPSVTLYDITVVPTNSEVHPAEVDLETKVGRARLPIPIFAPPMDTVTGPELAKKLSVLGGCGILYRHPDPAQQLAWAKEVLAYQWCMVTEPKCLRETARVAEAEHILNEYQFSTIPVWNEERVLLGVVFTKDIALKRHREDSVLKWMIPLERLKTIQYGTSFATVRERLMNEQECSVLPVIDAEKRLSGIYFMKDVLNANPCADYGRPLVGIAIGVEESDLDRVLQAVGAGVQVICIDSSHGDCTAVIDQADRVVDLTAPFGDITIIAGNVADVDGGGYRRLAAVGVHAVKVGIGSGSICTTTGATGVGVGLVTAIRACVEVRKELLREGVHAPAIIADGGVNGPGDAVKALLVGADAVMAGKWLVAATESHSAQTGGLSQDRKRVLYRGMASAEAIKARVADRYGKKKTAPEGVSGYVPHRGILKDWLPSDLELMRIGFGHAGAGCLDVLHTYGENPLSSTPWSANGREQAAVRVETD